MNALSHRSLHKSPLFASKIPPSLTFQNASLQIQTWIQFNTFITILSKDTQLEFLCTKAIYMEVGDLWYMIALKALQKMKKIWLHSSTVKRLMN